MPARVARTGAPADVHFAALPREEIAQHIIDRVDDYDDFLKASGLIYLWRRCWLAYQRGLYDNAIQQVGDQGEYTRIKVNHFRNILRHIYVNTTSTPPNMQPRAMNADFESRSQVEDSRGLLDYYMVEKEVEARLDRATEAGIVMGEGHVSTLWDPWLGEIEKMRPPVLGPGGEVVDPGGPIWQGDIRVKSHNPADVIRDVSREVYDEKSWLILRDYANRYDLIAAYPSLKDKILSLPSRYKTERTKERGVFSLLRRAGGIEQDSDEVAVYTLYHKRTPAVPLGRVTTVLDGETVLPDGDSTFVQAGYKDIPLDRVASGDCEGYPFGFSFSFDLLAPQEGVDLLYSTILTNQAAFGVQCLQAFSGQNISVSHLANGMTLIEYTRPDGKVEPLQLTQTAAEVFKFLEMFEAVMQTLSGVNSVERGNPEKNLKSGNALALVAAQALEFQRDFAKSRAKLVEAVGTKMVRLFRGHVTSPRIAAIVGKDRRTHLKTLQGSDIRLIDRVKVELGSPLLSTTAGRVNLGEQLVSAQMIESPEQLLTVITKGTIEPLVRGRQATLDLIQLENEAMLEGKVPDVLLTDDHVLHIQEHQVVLADPVIREKGMIVSAVLAHIQGHINELRGMPPDYAALLKQPVLAPQAPALGAGGGAADALGGAPAAAGDGGPIAGASPVTGPAAEIQGARMPENALTGEPYQPQGLQ